MVLGIGSGWTESEFRMTGIPFPPIAARLRQLDEALHCIHSLWRNETTTFDGEFYHLKDAIQWPKPANPPPILLGGGAGSEVMQRIAAPMVGGMLSAPLLSMLVIPAAYRLLRARELGGVQRR
jgi:alkanesulfonate monooxygenase SsuD/methylene tetrahydromethanopterin reductase-like flavin-dependent oxidoreductase (luciferase family)